MAQALSRIKEKIRLTPAQFIMLNFVGISLFGAVLLMLPIANTSGEIRNFVSAFFMSVSSVCVTGLAVVDVGKDFTGFGQGVLLLLMQVGGLSYMTVTTILMYMIGKKLSFSETKIFDLSNNSDKKINFTDFVLKIGVLTIIIEAVGFILLLPSSYEHPFNGDRSVAWFQALFHSVSAFCNAGLCLYSDSLIRFQDNFFVVFVFGTLIVLGGFGYTALIEVIDWLSSRDKKKNSELSFHTKICLISTAVIIISGIVIQLILIEAQNLPALEGKSFLTKFLVSFFQTVTSRTAGFNTIDINYLGDPNLLLFIILMIIGACPGGTAGGIKTTTIAVIFAMIWSTLRNDTNVNMLNRAVPSATQRKALTTFITTIIAIIIAVWLIVIFESKITSIRFFDKLFEVTSAFTTTGLSTGITNALSDPSKIVLCFCMLIGRPGTLLFLMSLVHERKYRQGRLPEEDILIG